MIKNVKSYHYWEEAKLYYKKIGSGYLIKSIDKGEEFYFFHIKLVACLAGIFLLYKIDTYLMEVIDECSIPIFLVIAGMAICFYFYISSAVVVGLQDLKNWYSYIYINKKYIYSFNLINPFSLRRLAIKDIDSISIRAKPFFYLYGDIDLESYEKKYSSLEPDTSYFLVCHLKNNRKRKLTFISEKLHSQQKLKNHLLDNRTFERPNDMVLTHKIIARKYKLRLLSNSLSIDWAFVFKIPLIGYAIIFILGATKVEGVLYDLGLLLVWLFYLTYFSNLCLLLFRYWCIKEVVVNHHKIVQNRFFLPFLKNYKINKQDIALFSTIAVDDTQYAIQIISQEGDIHQLPIHFENEEKAQEQVEAMKQMLRLE